MNEEMPIELVAEEIEAREEAERNGLYDVPVLNDEQEYQAWHAISTLSNLAKECDSSLSNLLKAAGYGNLLKELKSA